MNPNFTLIETNHVKSLNIDIEHYKHNTLGTEHYHFNPKTPHTKENVFMVALKTMPQDSTGVAHILEHTVLCGSKNYPVRDPFFSMIKRSVQTFMNAFTSETFTAYPFASQNKKDFNNLLDVYLDAVFFANINKEDFLQEGWRLDFTDEKQEKLMYKGVVFNEMKGAMSSASRENYHQFEEYFSTGSTHQFNAGGNPSDIPNLSHEQLKSFYNIFYHPQNCIFMTFGDIPAHEHQTKIHNQALQHFTEATIKISDLPIQELTDKHNIPKIVNTEHHQEVIDENFGSNDVLIGWVLGDSLNIEEKMIHDILISSIFGDSSNPLSKALEDFTEQKSGVISDLCSFNSDKRNTAFTVGYSNVQNQHVDESISIIHNTLKDICSVGITQDKIDSSLLHYEMSHKEISGSGYPYGLQLMMSTISSSLNKQSPYTILNIDPIFNKVKEILKNPETVKQYLNDMFTNNPHQMIYKSTANPNLANNRQKEEDLKLATLFNTLTKKDKELIAKNSKELDISQSKPQQLSLLPEILLSDLDIKTREISKENIKKPYGDFIKSLQGTNGLTYLSVTIHLPKLTEEEMIVLPIYTDLFSDTAVGNMSHSETNDWQSKKTRSPRASLSAYSHYKTGESIVQVSYSTKALNQNTKELTNVLFDTINKLNFSDLARIKYRIETIHNTISSTLGEYASSFSTSMAKSFGSAESTFNEQMNGYSALKTLNTINNNIDNPAYLAEISHSLKSLHSKIIAQQKTITVISSDEQSLTEVEKISSDTFNKDNSKKSEMFVISKHKKANDVIIVDTQVNYNAMSFEGPPSNHEDAPYMIVLSSLLKNEYLHTLIREKGGAYGANASYQNQTFNFSSYRDPRGVETYNDFKESINLFLTTFKDLPQKDIDAKMKEAILKIIQAIDKPGTPVSEVKSEVIYELSGYSKEDKEKNRQKILNTTKEDLIRVANKYLLNATPSICSFTNKETAKLLETEMGLNIFNPSRKNLIQKY